MLRKLCSMNNEEDITEILKGIAPLLRHKKRSILLMGGNYEEVNKETQEAIVSFMSTMPRDSAQTKEASQMPKKSVQLEEASQTPKECVQKKEASPTTCSPPHSSELATVPSPSPHITIGSESMQIDNTKVIVDKTEDPFKDFGASIVGNIVITIALMKKRVKSLQKNMYRRLRPQM